MDYIPWREIESWRCVRCGNCCTFKVNLSPYEYTKILSCWPKSIELDWLAGPSIKKIGRRCVFYNTYGCCNLQSFLMKPLACKVWPFEVHIGPQSSNDKRARFYFENREYYVYLNPEAKSVCHGIGKGNPDELPYIINEVLKMYKNPLRKQFYTTSRIF